MAEYIKVTGLTIKYMAKGLLLGLMVEFTRENIIMIKSMDMVFLNGLMEDNTMAHGLMGNNTA